MKLVAFFFLASALTITTSLSAEHDIASPVARMLLQYSLVTSVRTGMKHLNHAYPNFQGTGSGNYEQTAGKGSYTGSFKGVSTPYKTSANFKLGMAGSINYMGLYAKGTSGVKGNFHVVGKGPSTKLGMNAYYTSKMSGSVKGKKLNGKCSGLLKVKLSQGNILAKEQGAFNIYVGGKLIQGKYYASVVGNSASISVRGTYAGEPFFVKHSASLNVLALGMEMHPMAVKRNYGTISGTAGVKKFTRKYDQNTNPTLASMIQ